MKKITNNQWIEFCKTLQAGDIIFEETKNFLGKIIEWGTGDGSNVDPAHVFQYVGDGEGKIIEATQNGTNYSHIDIYKNKVLRNESRLVVYRIKNLSVNDLEKMRNVWNALTGKKYGWLSYIGWTFYGLINKFTPLGGFFKLGWIKNPFSRRDTPICSQVVYQAIEKVEIVKKVFLSKNFSYENCIPENLERIAPLFADRIIDTMTFLFEDRIIYNV